MVKPNTKAKQKTSKRVIVNSCLLLLMTIVLGVMTCCGVSKITAYSHSHSAFVASDSPALCFDEESDFVDGRATVRNGARICSTEVDENGDFIRVKDDNDYAMFLNERISFTAVIESVQLGIVLCVFGSMLTLASLISTIVYWNHNRSWE